MNAHIIALTLNLAKLYETDQITEAVFNSLRHHVEKLDEDLKALEARLK